MKKTFVDSDLQKTPETLDDAFGGILTPLKDTPAQEDVSGQQPLPESAAPTPESPEQSEPAVTAPDVPPAPEPMPAQAAPASAPAQGDITPKGGEGTAEKTPEELFEEILFGAKDVREAAEKIQSLDGSSDPASTKAQNDLAAEIEAFKAKEEAWKSAMEKAMNQIQEYESDKAMSDIELSRRSKLYDVVMNDEGLKTLVALKKRADEDPEYREEFNDFLTEYFQENTGKNISQLVGKVKRSEKEALGGGGGGVDADTDASEGMFGGLLTKI